MITIAFPAEEQLYSELQKVAEQSDAAIEDVILDAIHQYLQIKPVSSNKYSFIGIGHSGKGTISTDVNTILEEASKRPEGWSLDS